MPWRGPSTVTVSSATAIGSKAKPRSQGWRSSGAVVLTVAPCPSSYFAALRISKWYG